MVDDRLVTMQVGRAAPDMRRDDLQRVALGHGWPGALPVAWCRVLPWRRLLRARVRR